MTDAVDGAGDEGYSSFAAFVVARQGALLRSAYLASGDRQLAEDLVQEALTKLALRWDRVRHGSPEGFVRTVVYRDLISWRRRLRRERLGQPDERSGGPADPSSDPAIDTALRVTLRSALAGLTAGQRAVLVLRFLDDLSVRETAQVLGVSEGTVKSQTHAALDRLRAVPELGDLLLEERHR